jgi:hypothetical protein
MGHHARTLTALLAVLATTLVVTSTAAASASVVRVETKPVSISEAFVNRTAVDPPAAVRITNPAPQPGDPDHAECAATSPVAAVAQAVGGMGQLGTSYTDGHWAITSVKGQPPAPAAVTWRWALSVDQTRVSFDEACTSEVPTGSEVLLYAVCLTPSTSNCYTANPIYFRVRDGGPYDVAEQSVPGRGAPVVLRLTPDPSGALPTVTTDEGIVGSWTNAATYLQAGVSFTAKGSHAILAYMNNGSRPPGRMNVCVTEGNDGFCGTTRYQPPAEIPYDPSPCSTNGQDGFCGTTDRSGPITHVVNITNKKQFKKKKGPGQVTGTIDVDPNGVKYVKLRLTRTTTSRVLIKAKKKSSKSKAKKSAVAAKAKKKSSKKRYKTVKRCTVWDHGTGRLESAKCGTKYAKWFDADLNDLRNGFSYSFALTLPAGSYRLEVDAADENGFKDPPAAGRNVLTFVVL